MSVRTDLAIESANYASLSHPKLDGVEISSYQKADFEVTSVSVLTHEAAKKLSKPTGKYVTLQNLSNELDSHPQRMIGQVELFAQELRNLAENADSVLVVGLGNESITPDSLGPLVCSQIFATRHIKQLAKGFDTEGLLCVSAIAPGVLGQTGIEAAEIISSIVNFTKPSLVVAVDALACSELSHLGTTVQLSDAGISPGSGVANSRKELSRSSLGVPVIAVGVPTVADMSTIAEGLNVKEIPESFPISGMIVTPRSIDKLIERTARLIALGINRAFQPTLSVEEIISLL